MINAERTKSNNVSCFYFSKRDSTIWDILDPFYFIFDFFKNPKQFFEIFNEKIKTTFGNSKTKI